MLRISLFDRVSGLSEQSFEFDFIGLEFLYFGLLLG